MLISEDLLLLYGATITELECPETLFTQNDIPEYYYQLVSGTIKLTHYNNGTEVITDLLEKGAGIGEFLLFTDKRYPFNAVACEFCKILQLSKTSFLKLLEDNPEVRLNIIKQLYIDIEKKS
ncbi:hypothetical protein BBH99_17620 [Chryseobacterium contaminans]|uniref:Cyclic nucleotide-binding domain-containing protein n=1 Tax=Chryseobacterium contaminans TaxID=1423959 RepID=A0A1M6Z3P3_9FLAO|nr:cyclic nucleotide-binding domain-containing protein [Chryseobacterium contaminans]OCA79802.1 hypothetical protein BBH99_17620 [Chryseobacterium contaminans]SHL24929.1 Cyclic nucleotide-binding domain-containing protein [Chryseobacterium contaminans]